MANTKRQRNQQVRREKDGDVIMTDKVQQKKDKKLGKQNDGLSKEER
jgi:hypothetical protein